LLSLFLPFFVSIRKGVKIAKSIEDFDLIIVPVKAKKIITIQHPIQNPIKILIANNVRKIILQSPF